MQKPQKGKKPLKNLLIPLDFKLHETFQTQRTAMKAFSLKNKNFNHKSTHSEFSLSTFRKTTDSMDITPLPTPEIPTLTFFKDKEDKGSEKGISSLFLHYKENKVRTSKKMHFHNYFKETSAIEINNTDYNSNEKSNKGNEEKNAHRNLLTERTEDIRTHYIEKNHLLESGIPNERILSFPKGSNRSSLDSRPKSDLQGGYLTSLRLFSREMDLKRCLKGEGFFSNEYDEKNRKCRISPEGKGNEKMTMRNSEKALNFSGDRACLINCERLVSFENQGKMGGEKGKGAFEIFENDKSSPNKTNLTLFEASSSKKSQKIAFFKKEDPNLADLKRTIDFQAYLRVLGHLENLKQKKAESVGKNNNDEFSIYAAISNRQSILKDLTERLTHKRKTRFSQKISTYESITKRASFFQSRKSTLIKPFRKPEAVPGFFLTEKDKYSVNQYHLVEEILTNIEMLKRFKTNKLIVRIVEEMLSLHPKISESVIKERKFREPVSPRSFYSRILIATNKDYKEAVGQGMGKNILDPEKVSIMDDLKNYVVLNSYCKLETSIIIALIDLKNRLQALNISIENDNYQLTKNSILTQHEEVLEKQISFLKKRKTLPDFEEKKGVYNLMREDLRNRFGLTTTVLASDLSSQIQKCEEKFGVLDGITDISKLGLKNLEETIMKIKHRQFDLNDEIE